MQINRIQELHQLFKGMANSNRLVILEKLMEKKMNVTELAATLGMGQSHASHDLAILKKCGLVSMEKSGKHRIMIADKETVGALFEVALKHIKKVE